MSEVIISDKKICSGSTPLVCVSLMGGTLQELAANLDNIMMEAKESNIDIIEFRGDFYKTLEDEEELAKALSYVRENADDKILLFTIRSPKEGGQNRSYDRKSIEAINTFVIDNKLADMVDVELFSVCGGDDCDVVGDEEPAQPEIIRLAKERDVKIIMSNHDFQKTPAKEVIVNRLVRMQQLGADVAKIAVMPKEKCDLLTLLQATAEAKAEHKDTPIVTMSMGSLGAISRVAGEVFGSAITFGAVGEVSAPGQIPVKELNSMLESMHKYCV